MDTRRGSAEVSIDFELDVNLPSDEAPADVITVEYPCKTCGKEAGPYGGRGRKPQFCTDHKKQTTATNPSVRTSARNQALAAQAADTLCQLNALIGTGILVVGYRDTASVVAASNDTFREQAYQALLSDAELCRMILRGGAMGAKAALIMAYGMLGATVASAAVVEYRDKKEERESGA